MTSIVAAERNNSLTTRVLAFLRREGEPRSRARIRDGVGQHPHAALEMLLADGRVERLGDGRAATYQARSVDR